MLRALFKQPDVSFTEDSQPDQAVFRMTMEGPTPTVIARVLLSKQRLVIHFYFRRTAPAVVRAKAAEFISRVNYGLVDGNLQLSFDSGTIRYKSSIDFTNVELPELLVRNMMLSAMGNLERIMMPLWDVLDEDAEPAAAAGEVAPPEDAARFEP
jgi:hypothetical protein